jgi:hypothetical protein
MQYQASKAEIKRAQTPHNLFVSGLFLIDLSMTPAVIVLKLGLPGLLLTLYCSVSLIGYIYLRSRKTTTWFVDAHWRLSWSRGRLLLLGYGISAGLIAIAWLVSQTAHEASMAHIMWTAMTRIALVPTLIFVMITAVMEANAIGLASKREVPDNIVSAFPPPTTQA